MAWRSCTLARLCVLPPTPAPPSTQVTLLLPPALLCVCCSTWPNAPQSPLTLAPPISALTAASAEQPGPASACTAPEPAFPCSDEHPAPCALQGCCCVANTTAPLALQLLLACSCASERARAFQSLQQPPPPPGCAGTGRCSRSCCYASAAAVLAAAPGVGAGAVHAPMGPRSCGAGYLRGDDCGGGSQRWRPEGWPRTFVHCLGGPAKHTSRDGNRGHARNTKNVQLRLTLQRTTGSTASANLQEAKSTEL
eukprot:1160059-Pelagomonas_calceolata.AAC.2